MYPEKHHFKVLLRPLFQYVQITYRQYINCALLIKKKIRLQWQIYL